MSQICAPEIRLLKSTARSVLGAFGPSRTPPMRSARHQLRTLAPLRKQDIQAVVHNSYFRRFVRPTLVMLGTDDPGFFGSGVAGEYRVANAGVGRSSAVEIAVAAIDAAFCDARRHAAPARSCPAGSNRIERQLRTQPRGRMAGGTPLRSGSRRCYRTSRSERRDLRRSCR